MLKFSWRGEVARKQDPSTLMVDITRKLNLDIKAAVVRNLELVAGEMTDNEAFKVAIVALAQNVSEFERAANLGFDSFDKVLRAARDQVLKEKINE